LIDPTLSASEQARLYRACARKYAAAAKAERKADTAARRATEARNKAADAVAAISKDSYTYPNVY
jgi:hypothetical protein